MNSGKVSIVIPTYNRAHFLPETLDSIASQTYTNWECIVIDDGSSDDTSILMESHLEKDKRFKYFDRPHNLPKGANSCRNYGFEIADGEFIKWFDSDDIMLEDHLEQLVKLINTHQLDFAVGDSVNFHSETFEETGKPYVIDRNLSINKRNFATQKIGWITDDFLGKRESIGQLKFNTDILTDGDEYNFFIRYLFKTDNGKFLNSILTKHRIHESALSSPSQYSEIERLLKVSKVKFLTYCDIKELDDRYLNEWFLKGYMLNSYFLTLEGSWPYKFFNSCFYITKELSAWKALSFFMSIFSAKFLGKGYTLLQSSRK